MMIDVLAVLNTLADLYEERQAQHEFEVALAKILWPNAADLPEDIRQGLIKENDFLLSIAEAGLFISAVVGL